MRLGVVAGLLLAASTASAEPHVMFELGGNARQFAGNATVAARTATPEANVETAALLDLRLIVGVTGGFYAGLDNEVGKVATEADAQVIESTGVLGYRFDVRGGALATEMAGGIRSFLHDPPSTEPRTGGDLVGVMELRVRGELRLNPWLATGGTIGTSLVDRGDWVAGLFLAVHNDRR